MHEPKASALLHREHYYIIRVYIMQCQVAKCVLKILFLAKVTFNQADALKFKLLLIHTLLHSSAFGW